MKPTMNSTLQSRQPVFELQRLQNPVVDVPRLDDSEVAAGCPNRRTSCIDTNVAYHDENHSICVVPSVLDLAVRQNDGSTIARRAFSLTCNSSRSRWHSTSYGCVLETSFTRYFLRAK